MKEGKHAVYCKSTAVVSLGTSLNCWICKTTGFPNKAWSPATKENTVNFIRHFMLRWCFNLVTEHHDLRLCGKRGQLLQFRTEKQRHAHLSYRLFCFGHIFGHVYLSSVTVQVKLMGIISRIR